MSDINTLARDLAEKLGIPIEMRDGRLYLTRTYHLWDPTGDWSQIGRLIEQHRISLHPEVGRWVASCGVYQAKDEDPRVAVVRVILAQEG